MSSEYIQLKEKYIQYTAKLKMCNYMNILNPFKVMLHPKLAKSHK